MNRLICLLLTLLAFEGYAAQPSPREPVTLHLVGDSTMSIKLPEKRPETGWGEKLGEYFGADLRIRNHAKNGRSSKSFREEGRWDKVRDDLHSGDFVIIQFGHNDQKENDPGRFTNPYSTYRHYLELYVRETRAKGATPILISSIVRRHFNEQGSLVDTLGPYPEVVRVLAREMNVEFIDLHTLSELMVSKLGPEASRDLYLHLAAGENANYPQGVNDDTHLRPAGARAMADMVAWEVCRKQLSLSPFLISCN